MRVEEIFLPDPAAPRLELPVYDCAVAAGFPSPADDHVDVSLDLNNFVVKNPATTFFVRVSGNSMIQAGIHDGDILSVDRSLRAANNKIVIAVVNGECTVKRIRYEAGKTYLVAENGAYPVLEVIEFMQFEIWGVVTAVVHPL